MYGECNPYFHRLLSVYSALITGTLGADNKVMPIIDGLRKHNEYLHKYLHKFYPIILLNSVSMMRLDMHKIL